MDNRDKIKNLIINFSGKDNVIPIPVIYIKLLEDYHVAAFLNQLVYWSDKTKRTDGYFYKTYKEWHEELRLSRYQIDKSIAKLKELGLIETALKKANGAPTLHYKLNTDKLSTWICEKLTNGFAENSQMDLRKTNKSLTENTTENTTERDDIQNSIDYINHNLEMITSPMKIQEIEYLVNDIKNQKLEIVKVATNYCKENRKGINYLIKVLTNWVNENIDTKEKAEDKIKPKAKKVKSDNFGDLRQKILGGASDD